MNKSGEKPKAVAKSYQEAEDELREIVNELQEGDVAVEELVQKIERSAELVKYCKAQIEQVEMQVEEVIAAVNTNEDEDQS